MGVKYLTGIVFGAIFGFLFLVTCLISAVKAVRDRKRIKEKIAAKARGKPECGTSSGGAGARGVKGGNAPTRNGIEETSIDTIVVSTVSDQRSRNGTGHADQSVDTNGPQKYSPRHGVDNLTFTCAERHTNNELKELPPQVTEEGALGARALRPRATRSVSRDSGERETKRVVNHLPAECLAVQKTLRRHSYELAVGEHSWLPMEAPSYASSKTIVNTYSFGERTAGFENKAFDIGDSKKT